MTPAAIELLRAVLSGWPPTPGGFTDAQRFALEELREGGFVTTSLGLPPETFASNQFVKIVVTEKAFKFGKRLKLPVQPFDFG